MKVYNQLLQEIKSELSKENIESNDNQINLYDLYNLVNQNYKDLRSTTQNKKAFTNKELFRKPSYESIEFGYDENGTWIMIWFKNILTSSCVWIQKENGSKDFFIKQCKVDSSVAANKFMKKYYDEIIKTLFALEKYSAELYEFQNNINKFNIEYNNYKFDIHIGYHGRVDLNIKLKDTVEHKEMYERQYYGKDTLIKILEDSKFELAKKIKIDINTLDNSIIDVIKKSKENNNKKLIK